MKYLAYLLLIGAFFRHNTSNWIAAITGANPRAIFYIEGGLWEAALCALVLGFIWEWYWREDAYRYMAVMGCLYGMGEGLQMSVCRLFADAGHGNLCDSWTGLPVGATTTSLYTFYICYFSPLDMRKAPMVFVPLIASAGVMYLVNWQAGLAVLAVCLALRGRHGRTL